MRNTRWAALGAAIALSVTAGCAGVDATTNPGDAVDRDAAETTEAEQAAEEESENDSADSAESAELAEETEQAEETEAAELGTRQNPASIDDVGTFSTSTGDEVEVTLGAANWDAGAVVAGENQFNEPPGEGMVYVILPVTVSYSGPESVLPWIDITVVYLAENGRSYETAYAVIPDDLMDVADIYDGGTATGNVLFEVPADQVTGGLWGVSYSWGDELWWAAA